MAERMIGPNRMREAKGTGIYVRKRRLDLKLSQKELAELASVTEATISRIESGQQGSQMPYETLRNLAGALGESIDDFLAHAVESEHPAESEEEVNGRTPGGVASGKAIKQPS